MQPFRSTFLFFCEGLILSISKFSGVFCILDYLQDMGPTVSFNLKRPDGSWYGYREVEKLASLSGIQLRVNC